MSAAASANPRVKNPVYHFVISWPSDEEPDDEVMFKSARHAMKALDMEGHQYVSAIHRDTDDAHIHVAVNRVHPVTGKSIYPLRDYLALDHAMRELELQYGFKHDNGPHKIDELVAGRILKPGKSNNTREKMPTRARDMERHGDYESLFSYVRGDPRKAVLKLLREENTTWESLHAEFRKFGLELRPKGQGMAIFDINRDAKAPVKASDMSEMLSKQRLEKRLGKFSRAKIATPLHPVTKDPGNRYDRFRKVRRNVQQRDQRRQERADARRDLLLRYRRYRKAFQVKRLDPLIVKAQYNSIRLDSRLQRHQIMDQVRDPAMRKALYSVVAFETARARLRLRKDIADQRAELSADPNNQRLTYRSWVAREAAAGDQAALSQLRGWSYSDKRAERELRLAITDPDSNAILLPTRLDPAAAHFLPGINCQIYEDGSVHYKLGDTPIFIDAGNAVIINPGETAIDVAVTYIKALATGEFQLRGNETFKSSVRAKLQQLATHQSQGKDAKHINPMNKTKKNKKPQSDTFL